MHSNLPAMTVNNAPASAVLEVAEGEASNSNGEAGLLRSLSKSQSKSGPRIHLSLFDDDNDCDELHQLSSSPAKHTTVGIVQEAADEASNTASQLSMLSVAERQQYNAALRKTVGTIDTTQPSSDFRALDLLAMMDAE
jgi:Asp/Glu/hydantoin racemase